MQKVNKWVEEQNKLLAAEGMLEKQYEERRKLIENK